MYVEVLNQEHSVHSHPVLKCNLLLLLTVMLFTAAAYEAGLKRLTPLPGSTVGSLLITFPPQAENTCINFLHKGSSLLIPTRGLPVGLAGGESAGRSGRTWDHMGLTLSMVLAVWTGARQRRLC